MAQLLCLLFGHQKTLVPFSRKRSYCRRCGLDLDETGDTPNLPAVPSQKVKLGAARRLHR
jgi:Prophage protein (DUF1660)